MKVQVLASGSQGNCTLVRAGETTLLVDAGLTVRDLCARLDGVRVPHLAIDHIALTHGHLDHCRGAGALARRCQARVHCPERIATQKSVRRARELSCYTIGRDTVLGTADDPLRLRPIRIPHDADPTVAFRIEHRGRRLVLITDMGHPVESVAKELGNPHMLVLEFNHDATMLANGTYKDALKRRILGHQGHLSNDEAAWMLQRLAGPDLHTLVLAHLSANNNTPELALSAARAVLGELGRDDVQVVVALQDEPLPAFSV